MISLAVITDKDGRTYYINDTINRTNTTVPQKEDIITPEFMNSMISAITSLEGTVAKIDNCGYTSVCCEAECYINTCIPKTIDCNYCEQCNPAEKGNDSSDNDDS